MSVKPGCANVEHLIHGCPADCSPVVTAWTPGRLTFGIGGQIEAYGGATPIAFTYSRWVGLEQAEANTRRLIACWNALEGVPTEAIEALPADSQEHARRFVLRLAQSKGEPS